MELVVAEFEGYIQVYHHAGQDPEGEAKEIDGCRQLIAAQTAQGKKQLVFYHVAGGYAEARQERGHF